ncbi:hypothetical protein [Sporomusa sp. KB1]|jgi:hypothetical protein|uniref:hypothetical protein n=1 Tax=Sporomusa sp. KB1 TaxID=943346 RepID=UPI00119D81B3|nr:hypothetical protein [Sporomusa sp. KB1]TWH45916.1 hypothetical protein Salpa_1848 [Sporomusa sp. KB1]
MHTKTSEISPTVIDKAPKVVQLAVEVNGDTFIESYDGTKGVIIAINEGSTVFVREMTPTNFRLEFAVAFLKTLTQDEQNLVISSLLADRLGVM